MQKNIHVEIKKSAIEGYDASFVMSASSPDRVNDTISPAAYKSVAGSKLIALWQHKQDSPIGFWENLRQEGDRLVGDLKVANTNLGKMIKQLIDDGVPLGASIGFTGEGKRNEKGGVHFTALNLLECSIVSIPAHPSAMQIAKSFGMEDFVEPLSSGIDEEAASGHNLDEILQKSRSAVLAANKTLRSRK